MDKQRFEKQIAFILEIDKEKNILRQTHLSNHGRQENDAEHAWHMAIMIYLLKEYANEQFDIARAMIHNPEILILDEPTTGLDPGTRKKIWKVLNSLRKNSKLTIFLTTHYMEEAVDSDYIVILDKGSIVAEGTPLELKNKFAYDMILIYNINEDEIKKLNKPYTKIRDGFKIEIKTLEEATELIIKNKSLFKDYEVVKGKMDDVFLNATGYDLEVE